MIQKKISTLFIVAFLALAGIGITYAGWTDTIYVTGTVETGDVDIDIVGYSGTWVWKHIPIHGLERVHTQYGMDYCVDDNYDNMGRLMDPQNPNYYGHEDYEMVACAWAQPSGEFDETGDDDGVDLFFDNLFPCQDFTVDFILHYVGSIPAQLNGPILIDTYPIEGTTPPPGFDNFKDSGMNWLEYLWYVETDDNLGIADGGIELKAYRCDENGNLMEDAAGNLIPVDIGYQLHYCNYVYVKLIIHIPQDNDYQGLSGAFSTQFEVIQWDEGPSFPQPGPIVQQGEPDWTKGAGVRYKGYNTGGEIYLGVDDLGVGSNRVETNYNDFQTAGQKTYQVTFAYDDVENKITTSITSPDAALSYDFDDLLAPGVNPSDWDCLEVVIRDSRDDSGAAFENVMLDTYALGDFGTVDKAGKPGWQNWHVTGFDFSQSFTVTADLVVDGYNGNEAIKVEFNVGQITP